MGPGLCERCGGTGQLPLFTHTYQCEHCVDGQVYNADPDPGDTLEMFFQDFLEDTEEGLD